MSGAYTTANDVDVDLRRLFASLAVRWKRIVVASLIITGAAFAIAWLSTPHYKAETRLLIETQESAFTLARRLKPTRRCLTRGGASRRRSK